ncbi:glycine--tRNA ligase subunit beta [Caulobacter sp. 17J65-9]|uniref:glycine--tRNA ligase subunit beta n=1 Tax=Caulobacter sp. 17J65-9 TaxID=2709382 RepID=UPI0013CAACFF|nr:glycine--tRNA ligase subunit beta [Caulobacter sp. 17J65-9]NEX94281.1 glycine--tRNA ligase subunit beta [Caulobacter sp. 17J65-9]
MPQLLLELFSEEIPARMQANAARDLERMVVERLKEAGLGYERLQTFAGPRRLTLVADGLPAAQEDRVEERKGPRANAPEQALAGFLRSTGMSREQLEERDGVLFARIEKKGRPTPEIVAETVEAVVRGFPWPKSMTWGRGSLRWVRPLRRILCVFDGRIVPLSVDGIVAGDLTEGHRFMGSKAPFRALDFAAYSNGLAENFVVLDAADRKARILETARSLCAAQGFELVEDEGLLDEVSGLAEWPVPILGVMDPAFLDLPPEVIRTSMRTHQKYFAVREPGSNRLAPHFIAVANIEARDGGTAMAAGYARVLSARLNDARFFWDEDRKIPLEDRLEKLKGVTFHAKLGTMHQRVERITALARAIAPLVHADPALAAAAAGLAKADLATGMVGEFPELQGIMGGYYARQEPYREAEHHAPQAFNDGAEDPLSSTDILAVAPCPHSSETKAWYDGLSRDCVEDVAVAIRDHYKPQGPADAVPLAPVSVAVALADKLDTLVGFFAIDEKPTGSKDPFALRRAALGVIRIALETRARFSLRSLVEQAGKADAQELAAFFADRLKVLLRDEGKRYDLVDAVFALGDDDLVRIVARVEALDGFLHTEDGKNLLAGYRRAVNILKAEAKKTPAEEASYAAAVDAGLLGEAEEKALAEALAKALGELEQKLGHEDFKSAMAALSGLRGPVDAFFDKVLVNDPDPAVRLNRLRLLSQIRDAANRVADFSLIAG